MSIRSNSTRMNRSKLKRAWLLTWIWAGNDIGMSDKYADKFVAIISSRYSSRKIEEILEQYYVSSFFSLPEQFAYVKSKKGSPFKVRYNTIAVPEQVQKLSSLPSRILSDESMIIGGNPWLWGRIVYDLETWRDENDIEYLKWKEREDLTLGNDKIEENWKEYVIKRK